MLPADRGKAPIMDSDVRQRAEAFIDKVVVPRVAQTRREDPETLSARAEAGRADTELARRALQGGGLDLERLDTLAADRSKARQERLHQAHRRAVAASDEVARRLNNLAPALPPPDTMNVIIDRVTFIRSFADAGTVVDSNIGSLDSWAQYRFDAAGDAVGTSGAGRLSFFTLWFNPRTDPVIMTAGARLVVNAYLSVDADWEGVGAWFLFNSGARAAVRARTTVWGMDSSVSSIVQDRILSSAAANGGFFGGDDSTSIAFDEFLNTSGVSVPAQSWALIEVSVLTEWTAMDGSVHLDAQSGSFKISVPWLVLTIT
jgi:hypothetical protein